MLLFLEKEQYNYLERLIRDEVTVFLGTSLNTGVVPFRGRAGVSKCSAKQNYRFLIFWKKKDLILFSGFTTISRPLADETARFTVIRGISTICGVGSHCHFMCRWRPENEHWRYLLNLSSDRWEGSLSPNKVANASLKMAEPFFHLRTILV